VTAVHEHGVARDLLATVARDFVGGDAHRRIVRLRLLVREGAGIDPGFLLHGLEEEGAAMGGPFAGTVFEVDEAPLRLFCPLCGFEAEAAAWDGRCPACGGFESRPVGGEIDVAEVALDAPRGAPVGGYGA
jgi:Zn finger protein HypA/HybF involved in hydrogenase expression